MTENDLTKTLEGLREELQATRREQQASRREQAGARREADQHFELIESLVRDVANQLIMFAQDVKAATHNETAS